MKGLEEYIKVHGKHFTEKLAYKAAGNKWSASQIKKASQKKVYYNVTESTLGDMVYITNAVYLPKTCMFDTFNKCVDFMLSIIEDSHFYDKTVFDEWLLFLERLEDDMDFTPYI